MSMAAATRHLWWKELRQSAPLATTLVLLSLMMLIIHAYLEDYLRSEIVSYLLIAAPVLFSIGAGALIVGQEKESRTLWWLSSLPIPPRQLILTQFAAGAVVLTVLWLMSFAIRAAITQSDAMAITGEWLPTSLVAHLCLNSFYLLVCGYATAWLFRSSFVGLLSIVPLAVLPPIATYSIQYARAAWAVGDSPMMVPDPPFVMTASALAIAFVAVAWPGYRVAQKRLAGKALWTAATRRRSTLPWVTEHWESVSDRLRRDSRRKTSPPAPTTSLLWQFTQQNRPVLIGLCVLFLIGLPAILSQTSHPTRHATLFETITPMGSFAALCWMAMLTFSGDATGHRARFLAEHGVAPARVWYSRHILPAASFVLVFGLAVWSDSFPEGGRRGHEPEPAPLFMLLTFLGGTYAVSQWLGQLIRPTALAAVAVVPAVLFSGYVAAWLSMSLGTHWAVLSLSWIVLPLVATRAMTRRWMDGRFNAGYWGRHATFFACAAILPVVPFGIWWLSSPGFSRAEREALLEEAEVVREKGPPVIISMEPHLDTWEANQARSRQMLMAGPAEARDLHYEYLSRQLPLHGQAVSFRDVDSILVTLTTLRNELDRVPEITEDTAEHEVAARQYREWMQLTLTIVQGLRRSREWTHHEIADHLEIWLVSELKRSESRSRLGGKLYDAVVLQVSDRDARWEARRKMVLISMSQAFSHRSSRDPSFGQVRLFRQESKREEPHLIRQRRRELLFKTLLEGIAVAKAGGVFPAQRVAMLLDRPPEYYGAGLAGPYYRIDDVTKFGLRLHHAPASQWGAGWEMTAQRLSTGVER